MKNCVPKFAVLTALTITTNAYATNGMNLEGYGPVARGMGGAGMAYENGVAAIMNNPATLSLMQDKQQRLDMCLSFLGPDVQSSIMGNTSKSGGDTYWMPAAGWATKKGDLSYGMGVFAQGGMGTEYENGPLSLFSGPIRSEVGVGRVSLPLAFQVDRQLAVGATLDYVWAGMDLQMAIDGDTLGRMMMRDPSAPGSAGGAMVNSMMMAIQGGMMPMPTQNDSARFDFSNDNDFTGEAKGGGLAGKLGLHYQVNEQLSVGMAYHLKTYMTDLETDNATLSMNLGGQAMPIPGKITVKDFEWPALFAVGMAYNPIPELMIAADVKHVRWAEVMRNFNVTFTADAGLPGLMGAFGGQDLDSVLFQNWDDQTIFSLGGAYKVTPALTVRAGFNLASNPVPDATLNYLFPATVKNHYSAGVGYQFSPAHAVNFAFIYAPEVTATSGSTGVTTSHSQINWCFAYSYSF